MISPTLQEHRAARERAKQREPEPQRPAAQRRQEAAARQPHSGHAPAGDDHHPLRKERPAGKSPARTPERGRAAAERPALAGLPAARRDEESSAATPDGNLFSMLMDRDEASLPGALQVAPHAAATPHPTATPASSGAGAPMALWQPLENELDRALVNPPAGPVSVTLLLPRLGDVDARLQALPAGGWDIALRFAPAALDALAAHEERCRHSLRRRLACRVRLRFEQRGEWA
ncbi:Uncharacterised protein [Serratia rubidaea]|uniref:Type III secretion system protein n=1 Tax=Serratia rubidaea TaxID=61652 RepID=A0A4U9HX33_SERRU|nr:type III secretion system HrpP C-terminal domain-containing protein [Serratia rubidaea]QPR64336.1 hypothetical protein I6G83_03475 [Serratia rubidaea]CAI1074368.1 Uncharacterised protein [Serratia rubidaea]CAI1887446.1 Uncharacterised protein [Serratia rubidaea]VTP67159.1 Uncharacterised protein [Serratia rubidaea]HAY0638411.1 hypothetical protein [Serratia rubidaea]